MGTANLVQIPTDRSLAMRIDLLEQALNELYENEARVAFVMPTFGTTDGFGCDNVAEVYRVIHEVSARHNAPVPHLHVDAAVGWALCFLHEYDTERNTLKMSKELLPVVNRVKQLCVGLRHADSITIDFHKMGRGHYPSSAFIVNRRDDLKYLSRTTADTPYFPDADVRRDPAMFTLETSRPGLGPYIVMASLNGLGLQGWQMLVARSLELAHYLKTRLNRLENCIVINPDTVGSNVVFWVLPKGRNAEKIFAQLEAGELPPEEAHRYFGEVRRQFEKREKNLDPRRDARLSLTTSVGYRPHGYNIPAWKAVFFNPKTDELVIDRLIQGIEEVL